MREKRRSELLRKWTNKPRMVADFQIKEKDDDKRTFRGSLSTSHLDLGYGGIRDIAMPGSFNRWTIHFKSAKDPYVPLIDSHDYHSIFNVYGHLLDTEERMTGKVLTYELEHGDTLEVEEMNLDTEWRVIDGDDGMRLLDRLRPGSVRKMSMGYDLKKWDMATLADGGELRLLNEQSVEEGSLVVFPMNPHAEVDIGSVKVFLDELDPKGLTNKQKAELSAMQEEIGALLAKPGPAPDSVDTVAVMDRIRRIKLARLATRIRAARHSAEHVLTR